MGRVYGKLLAARAWALAALPHRQNKQLRGDTQSLQGKVESLQNRVQQLAGFSKNTRWLELESRGAAYVHLCRKLAPDIVVGDSPEPKILVTLKNVVPGITDGVDGEYFYLVGPTRRESGDKPNTSTWVADAILSGLIAELLGSEETGDTHLRLGVVGLDGNEEALELRWGHIQVPRGADGTRRALLTIEGDSHFVRPVDTLKSIATVLGVRGVVASCLARSNELHPNTLEEKPGGDQDGG